jgi:hypothetical protein
VVVEAVELAEDRSGDVETVTLRFRRTGRPTAP